jgi:hypothetical protein
MWPSITSATRRRRALRPAADFDQWSRAPPHAVADPSNESVSRAQRHQAQLYPGTQPAEPKQDLIRSIQVDPCQILIGPRKNLHAPARVRRARPGVPGRLRLVRRGDARCDVAMAVTPAPAQDVSAMLTTPPVHDFGCHLELGAVFAAVPDQRP